MCTCLITELLKIRTVRIIHDSLGFLHIPHYFLTITWINEASNFQKAKVQPKGVRFCFFSQPGVAYKQVSSSIEVLMGFINSRSSQRRCSIKIGVLKKFEKFTDSLF